MQFSDTSGQQGLIQDCEFWVGLGKAQISGDTDKLAAFTRLINNRYDYYVTMLLNAQDEWDFDDSNNSGYGIFTRNLVANQQDYVFSTVSWSRENKEGSAATASQTLDILKIKRVEITYDGTNWYKVEPIDINEIGVATDTAGIAEQFSTAEPYYDLESNAIKLYPIPASAVTGGLKVWIYRNVDAFTTTDTTQAPGFDRVFHSLLSMGASVDWMISKSMDARGDLSAKLQGMEVLFMKHYGNKQVDRNIELKPAFVNYT